MTDYKLLKNRVDFCCFSKTLYFYIALVLFGCSENPTEATATGEIPDDGTTPNPSFDLNASAARGQEIFNHVFKDSEGLGPLFVQSSCVSCHTGNGRGTPRTNLIRFSRGTDLIYDEGGPQLQDKSIKGISPETLPADVDISIRMGPPLLGIGLIDGIPDETLLSLEDPNDLDGDGISGRVNKVPPRVELSERGVVVDVREFGEEASIVGRFGRKSSVSLLIDQISLAFQQDMGITTDIIPAEIPNPPDSVAPFSHNASAFTAFGDIVQDPELIMPTLLDVLTFVRLLPPPERGEITPKVTLGDEIFTEIKCSSCHIPSLQTGPSDIPQLENVNVKLYSDLLLHDMGPELADYRPDRDATGTEWRTTPLWGLRVAGEILGRNVNYLHDGRTSDLTEAIRLHGGEAEASRNEFLNLSEADRNALIAFLLSL